jgi:hypothetical protein
MSPKHLELPPEIAQAFVRDMRAFFKTKIQLERDETAAKQCFALQQHVPCGTKLRLSNVKEMFQNLKDRV